MIEIGAYMLSCDERDAVRAGTLSRLAATDWGEPPVIEVDGRCATRGQTRQELAALTLLLRAADDGPDFVLFLEDDLDFNRHLRHNLEAWRPLQRASGELPFFASLYNPTIRARWHDPRRNVFAAETNAAYGSQAFLLSRATVRYVVDHWAEVPGMQDIKISRLAARTCPLLYHAPALVQHLPGASVWGGAAHHAPSFDGDWVCVPRTRTPAHSEQDDQALRNLAIARMQPVDGWLSVSEAELLLSMCSRALRRARGEPIALEVGSYAGRSTMVLGTAADAFDPPARVFAVDPHDGEISVLGGGTERREPTLELFWANLIEAGLGDVVVPVRRHSREVEWNRPLAFLFIDGLHDYESVATDTSRFLPWLAPNGAVAFHDYAHHFPGVRRVVDEMLEGGAWQRVGADECLVVLEREEGP